MFLWQKAWPEQILETDNSFQIRTGKVLRNYREENNKSQEEIAIFLGKDQSQISRIESGLEDIRFSEVEKFCKCLNLDLVSVVAEIKYCAIEQ